MARRNETATVALPRPAQLRRRARREPAARSRWLSMRVLAAFVLPILVLGGGYAAARDTSVFAIRSIDVRGASPAVAAQVRTALAPLLGRHLVGLDGGAVEQRVEQLPWVARASYDRAFPHTLRVTVVSERPVAVLRRGGAAWLVSTRGRVLGAIHTDSHGALPRIWVARNAAVRPGGLLTDGRGALAARSLALAAGFPYRIRTASSLPGSLTFVLASGLELRLGDPADLRLKLAVARRVMHQLPSGATYIDLARPSRPVSNSQLSGRD
jgi:cell division protein FtsQ